MLIKAAAAVPVVRVADTVHNAGAVIAQLREASGLGADVCVFPELCLTGCTCGDLYRHDALLRGAAEALCRILRETGDLPLIWAVGLPIRAGDKVYNCAAVCHGGEVIAIVPKRNLTHGESRWFSAGEEAEVTLPCGTYPLHSGSIPCGGYTLFVTVGEDMPGEGDVFLCLGAVPELVGAYDRVVTEVTCRSGNGVCVFSSAGEGESTTDAVYFGRTVIAAGGKVIKEGCGTLIVSEADTCARGEAPTASAEKTIRKNPFIPDDKALRDKRCDEILAVQAAGLRKRMTHTGAGRMVVGVSGGLDSTLALLVCAETAKSMGLSPDAVLAVTMPCFGTTARTKNNALILAERLGAEVRTVDITESVRRHFKDIGHDEAVRNVVYENAQARERTQVLMDIANGVGGLVIGTGDLSELALGWATYNGDHMSMYGVNAGVPKTLIRHMVARYAAKCGDGDLSAVLEDILATPVSPELLPADGDEISQKTEDLVGPYELHDFFLYWLLRKRLSPREMFTLAEEVFRGEYDRDTILKWLKTFIRRFFAQQFKRSSLPDGPMVGSVTLSPRGGLMMPSDASAKLWLNELEEI